MSSDRLATSAVDRELPLLSPTDPRWARLAAEHLGLFLADHAVCEQQAALSALNLVAHYPEDAELVERMTSIAVEEVVHLRRVAGLLRRRELRPMRRRRNPYVQGLRARARGGVEPRLKIDRLLVGALIEARSCERFTRLLAVLDDRDDEIAALLRDLGPAEKRHWQVFHGLAARQAEPGWFADHWRAWLQFENELMAARGKSSTVHG